MIAGGVFAELADTLMVTLGSCFESLSSEDLQVIGDIYTAAPRAIMMANAAKGMRKPSPNPIKQDALPHMLSESGGDKAGGSLAPIVVTAGSTNPPSSPEDESSLDEAPSGKVSCSLPISQ